MIPHPPTPQMLDALLAPNPYPGRGLILGQSRDGTSLVAAYFIMGRSNNSRNRVFVPTPDGIRTQAHDPSKVEDPSLILYHPVRQVGERLIVTNGDQTDTIRDALVAGDSFASALYTRTFEPDAPHFTPRISGLLDRTGIQMAILKSADSAGSACIREFFSYPLVPGVGHFLHTYAGDGAVLPSFTGEPPAVAIPDDPEAFASLIWDSLNAENKISLYLRYTPLGGGQVVEKIINRQEETP